MLFTEMLVIPLGNFPDSLMRPPEIVSGIEVDTDHSGEREQYTLG